jgi:hypothetical protein
MSIRLFNWPSKCFEDHYSLQNNFTRAMYPSLATKVLHKVEYPTTGQGLFIGQPRKFKYRKAVRIESTIGQDSTSPSCNYILCSV